MNEHFFMYLLTRIDNIQAFCGVVAFVTIIVTALFAFFSFLEKDEALAKVAKIMVIPATICLLIALLIPNKKDILFIYLTPKLINMNDISKPVEVIEKLPEIAKKMMDEYLEKK